jgi:flagellar protein FliS
MQYNNPYQRTMADKIYNASPEALIVMLYEGMVTKIKQAKERHHAGHVAKSKEAIIRSMRIADALMENINFKDGGQTAQDLELLYFYIISQLSGASMKDDPLPMLDNALRVVETLLEGWKQLQGKVSS